MANRLYVAYGSNLNIRQMKLRCPTAVLYGAGVIPNHELQFKGYESNAHATISPKKGSSVPAAVWDIKPRDEVSLDRYEGFPSYYSKKNIEVQLDGFSELVTAMVYIMNQKMDFGIPSPTYYGTVADGYRDCGLNIDVLDKAVAESTEQYYSMHDEQMIDIEDLFDTDENEDEFDIWDRRYD